MMSQSIEDYLINALIATSSLNAIKLFIRGYAPFDVPEALYPFVEVICLTEDTRTAYVGDGYQITYPGLITINVSLVSTALGDWMQLEEADRIAHVPSYDAVKALASAVVDELQKPAHKSMGGLTLSGEAVSSFKLTGPRKFGLEDTPRENTWSNFASLPFEVITERAV